MSVDPQIQAHDSHENHQKTKIFSLHSVEYVKYMFKGRGVNSGTRVAPTCRTHVIHTHIQCTLSEAQGVSFTSVGVQQKTLMQRCPTPTNAVSCVKSAGQFQEAV